MVETAIHPRPSFYTFLQTDSYRSGDALTYYDYQRAIRSKKVEILQQKKSSSYEPGYKKPGVLHPASRKVFQLKYPITSPPCTVAVDPSSSVKTAPMETTNQKINTSSFHESVNPNPPDYVDMEASASKTSLRPSSAKINMTDQTAGLFDGRAQTERLPRIVRKPRLIKSATAREHSSKPSVMSPLPLPERPKTVANTGVQTAKSQERVGKWGRAVTLKSAMTAQNY